jgi:DNA-directed RNA polymerase specialized sigma24 family protein
MYKPQKDKSWLSAEEEVNLVEKARGRDREAFEQLVKTFHKPLVGFILARSMADRETAEDIAQEVWVKAWEQIHRKPEENGYDPAKGRFYTFLINYIAIPKIRDWKRNRNGSRERTGVFETDDGQVIKEPVASAQVSQPDISLEIEEQFRLTNFAFLELLRLIFLCGGYPHQQFAFAYSKLIYGQPSSRSIEGAPEKVHHEHGAVPFETLITAFWDAYKSVSQLGVETLQTVNCYLDPIRLRLPQELGEILRFDNVSKTRFEKLLSQKAGKTCLNNYYADHKDGFTAAIPDWCYKVEKRIRTILGCEKDASQDEAVGTVMMQQKNAPAQPRSCNRCKIKHLPPCNTGYKEESG